MNISPAAAINASVQTQRSALAQQVQVAVLKKAMDVQASGALSLLQSVAGPLPLANSGSLGTKVNVMA